MFDYLVRMDPAEKVNQGVAEKWEVAPDGKSWTFYLRKGIKFQNGEDLKADDVKFSLERYIEKIAEYPYIRDSQQSVEIIDDYTVRVITKGVHPYYFRWVNFVPGDQGFIMPKDYVEKVGADYFSKHPVGSGPYKFVRHVPGDLVEYEAVDKHYRQTPAFKNLLLIVIPEEATRVAMMRTGAMDVSDISIESAGEVQAAGLRTAVLPLGRHVGVQLYGTLDSRAKGMPLGDIRVRQALSLAINRDEMSRTMFDGKLGYPMPRAMYQTQPEIDVPYWKAEAAKLYHYDVEAAKKLLNEAGYGQGATIKMYMYPDQGAPYLDHLAPVIQGYWLKIGVKTNIVPIDGAAFRPMKRSGPNRNPVDELVAAGALESCGGNPHPIRSISGTYWGAQGTTYLLAGGAFGAEVDGLIDAAYAEPNAAKRFEIVAKLLRMTMDTVTWLDIGTVFGMVGLGNRVNLDFPTGGLDTISAYLDTATHR